MKGSRHPNKVWSWRIILPAVGLVLTLGALYQVWSALDAMASELPQRVDAHLEKYGGSYVPLARLSPYLGEAAIASQDRRFWTDPGIDVLANFRAIVFTILHGQRQGASTITEQLAKNVYYHNVDSPATDVRTKLLALAITWKFPKAQILEMYLNVIYYGKGAYGIGKASYTFFRTNPANLALWQSAYLIGLINTPGYYDLHPEESWDEAKVVVEMMEREGFISAAAAAAAINDLSRDRLSPSSASYHRYFSSIFG